MSDMLAAIRQLYDGLWDESSWQSGLNALCASLRAHHIVSVNPVADAGDHEEPLCWGANVAPEHLQLLEREAGALMSIASRMRVGIAMDTAKVIPDRELVRTRIYDAVIRPLGGHYGMTASPFSGGLLAVCRPPTARRFAQPEIARLQSVLPYLETALRLKRHLVGLRMRTAALEHALEELSVGVLIAADSARILYANRSAETTLRSISEAVGSGALSRRMRDIIGRPDGRRHAISRGPSQRPVTVRAVPLSGIGAERSLQNLAARVAVFLRDPNRRQSAPRDQLMAVLRLTPREASLAELLARDMTLTEAANALAISRENARIHLKRIFSKTDTHRQAELVSLILRLEE